MMIVKIKARQRNEETKLKRKINDRIIKETMNKINEE